MTTDQIGDIPPQTNQIGRVESVLATVFLFVLASTLTYIAVSNESLFNALMWEDAWGEWATFFAFLFGGILGLSGLIRFTRRASQNLTCEPRRPLQISLLAVSTFCLLAAGEEISWGQRLLGLQPPELFQTLNFQQELNFHNILHYLISPRLIIGLICFGYGAALPSLARFRDTQNIGIPHNTLAIASPPFFLTPWFIATGLIYWSRPIWMSLEAAELFLSLLLFIDVRFKTQKLTLAAPTPRWSWSFLLLGLPLLLGAVTNPLIDRAIYGSDAKRVTQAQKELELIAWDLQFSGAVNPNLPGDGDLYASRIYNAFRNRWLYFDESGRFYGTKDVHHDPGEILRRTYFLDPWNNAYWIRMKGYEPIYLYSFGPNRRLDTILSSEDGIPTPSDVQGDDIGVWLDLYENAIEEQSHEAN